MSDQIRLSGIPSTSLDHLVTEYSVPLEKHLELFEKPRWKLSSSTVNWSTLPYIREWKLGRIWGY